MLNNDMIGYEPETDNSKWIVNIVDYPNSGSLRSQAESLCNKYTLLKYINDNTYSHYSDSYKFSARGYSALFFFARSMDPNYHTGKDLASAINFDYCREIVKLNCAILASRN